MLKLERDKHTRQVCIRTNRGEKLFTNLFLTALVAAITLHAAFFLIFRIDKGHENYPHLILPPVSVHAIPQQNEPTEHHSLTEYEANVLAKQSFYEPVPSPITIPPISSQTRADFVYAQIHAKKTDLFSSLETEFLLSELYPVEITIPIPQVTIHISGPLKELSYQEQSHPMLNTVIDLPIDEIEQARYTFSVIVDSRSGKVIWYEKDHEAPEELEDLLLALNFEKSEETIITKGHVEILTTNQQRKHD